MWLCLCAHYIKKKKKKDPRILQRKPQVGHSGTVSSSLDPLGGFPYSRAMLFLFSALSLSLSDPRMVLSINSIRFLTPGIISGMVPQNRFWI